MSRAHWYGVAGGAINVTSILWLLLHMQQWRAVGICWCVASILWIVGLFLHDADRQHDALVRRLREHQ